MYEYANMNICLFISNMYHKNGYNSYLYRIYRFPNIEISIFIYLTYVYICKWIWFLYPFTIYTLTFINLINNLSLSLAAPLERSQRASPHHIQEYLHHQAHTHYTMDIIIQNYVYKID